MLTSLLELSRRSCGLPALRLCRLALAGVAEVSPFKPSSTAPTGARPSDFLRKIEAALAGDPCPGFSLELIVDPHLNVNIPLDPWSAHAIEEGRSDRGGSRRSEEHTLNSSHITISYAVF